jgi:hypothetical protein
VLSYLWYYYFLWRLNWHDIGYAWDTSSRIFKNYSFIVYQRVSIIVIELVKRNITSDYQRLKIGLWIRCILWFKWGYNVPWIIVRSSISKYYLSSLFLQRCLCPRLIFRGPRTALQHLYELFTLKSLQLHISIPWFHPQIHHLLQQLCSLPLYLAFQHFYIWLLNIPNTRITARPPLRCFLWRPLLTPYFFILDTQ